jgi:hypothetical protein
LGDETEQAMFNLVPFAGAGWKVTNEQPCPSGSREKSLVAEPPS